MGKEIVDMRKLIRPCSKPPPPRYMCKKKQTMVNNTYPDKFVENCTEKFNLSFLADVP